MADSFHVWSVCSCRARIRTFIDVRVYTLACHKVGITARERYYDNVFKERCIDVTNDWYAPGI